MVTLFVGDKQHLWQLLDFAQRLSASFSEKNMTPGFELEPSQLQAQHVIS